MGRGKIVTIVIGSTLAAGALVTALFPAKIANLLLTRTLAEARREGIFVTLSRVSRRDAELSLEIPKWGVHLTGLHPRFRVSEYIPPVVEIEWTQAWDDVAGGGRHLEGVRLESHLRAGFFSGWASTFHLSAKRLDSPPLHGVRADISLDEKSQDIHAAFEYAGKKISFASRGSHRHSEKQHVVEGRGDVTLAVDGWQVTGPFDFSLREDEGLKTHGVLNYAPPRKNEKATVRWQLDTTQEFRLQLEMRPDEVRFADFKLRNPLSLLVSANSDGTVVRALATCGLRRGIRCADVFSARGRWELGDVAVNGEWRTDEEKSVGQFDVRAAVSPALKDHYLDDARFDVTFAGESADATAWKLRSAVGEKRWGITARGTGTADLARGVAALSFTAESNFSPNFQPANISRDLGRKLAGLSGRWSLRTDLGYDARRGPTLAAAAGFSQVRGKIAGLPVVGLAGRGTFDIWPRLRVTGNAELDVAKFGRDLRLEKFSVRGQPESGNLRVTRLAGDFCGGKVSAAPFTYFVDGGNFKSALELEAIDLAKLVSVLAPGRLSGKGLVRGRVPLEMKAGAFTIAHAELKNQTEGWLAYVDDSVRGLKNKVEYLEDFNDLLALGQQALAYKALSNFHYTILTLSLDRDPRGTSVALHFRGRNPDLANGQLFEFNLPISGDVEGLVKNSFMNSLMEKDEWQDKMQDAVEARSGKKSARRPSR